MTWTRKHLLGLEDLNPEEITTVLDTAEGFKEVSTRSIKKVPALRGKVVVNLFYEPSTRTRISFDNHGDIQRANTLDHHATLCDRGRVADELGMSSGTSFHFAS